MFDKEEVYSSLIRAVREGDLEGAKKLINSFGLNGQMDTCYFVKL